MVLRLRKEYPMLPVDPRMEPSLIRLGIVRQKDNRDQKGKYLHTLVDEDSAIRFHHFFLSHSRETCPPDESQLQCVSCGIRNSCDYYSKSRSSKRRRAAR